MAAAAKIIAGTGIATFMSAAAALLLPPGAADAGYGVMKPRATVSNAPAKSGLGPRAPRTALPQSLEVAEVRHLPEGFVLIDSEGREVYRSDRATRTTTVAKDAPVPLLTGLGVAVGRAEQIID